MLLHTAPTVSSSLQPRLATPVRRLETLRPVGATNNAPSRVSQVDLEKNSKAERESAEDLLRAAEALLSRIDDRPKAAASSAAASTSEDSASLPTPSEELQQGGVTLRCDVHGCTVVPVVEAAATPSVSTAAGNKNDVAERLGADRGDFQLWEGPNWRIGFDAGATQPDNFTAVITSNQWSFTLTQREFGDFIQLLRNLQHTIEIAGEWSDVDTQGDEQASLEFRTDCIWMQGRAPQKQLSALQAFWQNGSGGDESAPKAAFSVRFLVTSQYLDRKTWGSRGNREIEGFWDAETVMSVLQTIEGKEVPFSCGPVLSRKFGDPIMA